MDIQHHIDTIAAIATPPGQGGVAILRLSGPSALTIASAMTHQRLKPRYAHYTAFFDVDNITLDHGIAISFPAPHSFTGEDVAELQGHGGPIVMELLLKTAVAHGARIANPGEFSERAFLNDKMDLSQAEAIADLISASSELAARSATRVLQGEFAQRINVIQHQLTECRMHVESAIDFPEEEIDFLADDLLHQRAKNTLKSIEDLLATAHQGVLLRDGIRVVIAGKPNAGKSSLLNALTGQETAIVTDIPGTTRDLVHEQINLDGIPLHLTDTAGIREATDVVERIGVSRAIDAIETADVILLVVDATHFDLSDFTFVLSNKTLVIRNKIDLTQAEPGLTQDHVYNLSIKQNQGLDLLKQAIKDLIGAQPNSDNALIARQRHLDALTRAKAHLLQGIDHLIYHQAGELLAEECRLAQQALSEITGKFTPDDLLGEIFSNFCIGK